MKNMDTIKISRYIKDVKYDKDYNKIITWQIPKRLVEIVDKKTGETIIFKKSKDIAEYFNLTPSAVSKNLKNFGTRKFKYTVMYEYVEEIEIRKRIMNYKGRKSRLYNFWSNMKIKCANTGGVENHIGFTCDEKWKNYINFVKDIQCVDGYKLLCNEKDDRVVLSTDKNNDGCLHYSKDTVYFTTAKEINEIKRTLKQQQGDG